MSAQNPNDPGPYMENEEVVPAAQDRVGLIKRGLFWNASFQVFLAGVNFASMLLLVRLLSPQEYGRAAAVTGMLTLINCFSSRACMSQAIQLGDDETPDWTAHWRAGLYIQFALAILCNAVAGIAWLFPAYRPIAPLLHVASIGLLIDTPSQLAAVRLRREMNFRSLRLVSAFVALLTAASSIALALAGAGALALILSANVLAALPFGFYLLVIERWRPAQWWAAPDWRSYRAPLRFGAQQSGSAMVAAARGFLETLVIPPLLGYEALGLLNRAQVLFATTVGRVATLVVETVYPMLPRSAKQPEHFARHATLFVQMMLLLSIPGAVFVGIEGPFLSRLLYGAKWIAADPLIWPGTVFAWGVAAALSFSSTLLARNHLRRVFVANVMVASLCLPAIIVAAAGGSVVAYAWALALGQLLGTFIVARAASKDLQSHWLSHTALPPVAASILGAAMLLILSPWRTHLPLALFLILAAGFFGLTVLVVLRLFFSHQLREVLLRVPQGARLIRVLGLPQ